MNNGTPTQEELVHFWEWCGFEFSHKDFGFAKYKDPNGIYEYLPDVDLNNLFKYAVPKLDLPVNIRISYLGNEWVVNLINSIVPKYYDKDLALALFWAIYEVMKNSTER